MITASDMGNVYDLRGLSSDEKPDYIGNGSTFLEIDTGKIYIYDKEHDKWRELG